MNTSADVEQPLRRLCATFRLTHLCRLAVCILTGRPHTVPVVPIDHAGARWLVAPYGPVGWVHNVRAADAVTLRYGRKRQAYTVREATPVEAGPVLKRYVAVASRTRHCFAATVDAPVEAFTAEAAEHPLFEIQPSSNPVIHAG